MTIPVEWYETIMAYFLSDNGMADFERESYNLRQELNRLRDMYSSGFLTQAQFRDRATAITSELEVMQPSAKPKAREIVSFLRDFPSTWGKMTSREQRILLKVMFEAMYFDEKGLIRRTLVNSPFDRLLSVN
jgi:hypothetical protein